MQTEFLSMNQHYSGVKGFSCILGSYMLLQYEISSKRYLLYVLSELCGSLYWIFLKLHSLISMKDILYNLRKLYEYVLIIRNKEIITTGSTGEGNSCSPYYMKRDFVLKDQKVHLSSKKFFCKLREWTLQLDYPRKPL